jgi:hypothetical protein
MGHGGEQSSPVKDPAAPGRGILRGPLLLQHMEGTFPVLNPKFAQDR